jgi:hypothetical protein
MKPLLLFLFLTLATTGSSFASILYQPDSVESKPPAVAANSFGTAVHQKMSFFQKLFFKAFHKRNKRDEITKAETLATASVFYGVGALSSLLLVLTVPVIGVLAIPFSIIAILKGNKSLRLGTSKEAQAQVGKALGIITLVLVSVGVFACIIWLSSMSSMSFGLGG